jgi:hypothetical protein
MDKSSTLLKKLMPSTSIVTPSTTLLESMPIIDPTKLSKEQREAAFPFLAQELPRSKSSPSSKAKVKQKTNTNAV